MDIILELHGINLMELWLNDKGGNMVIFKKAEVRAVVSLLILVFYVLAGDTLFNYILHCLQLKAPPLWMIYTICILAVCLSAFATFNMIVLATKKFKAEKNYTNTTIGICASIAALLCAVMIGIAVLASMVGISNWNNPKLESINHARLIEHNF